MFIFRVLHTVPYSNEQGAKDLVASLHAYFTCNLLIGFAVLISWKQFGGKPIECMLPPDFTGAWGQYAENYCWAQDTYFVPFSSPVAILNETQKAERKVNYYQLMPFFLLFAAACFKFPTFIWKYFASQSGMRVGELLRIVTDDANTVPEVKKANIEALCVHLQGALRFHKRLKKRHLVPHKVLRFLNVKYSTYYVTFIYLLAKLCFLINVGLQANFLNRYLLPKHADRFGWNIWKSLMTGNSTWEENGVFPRVTLCDFEVREMGNVQNYTVQCVLLVNIFAEKIFLVLWLWYHVLSAFTVLNFLSWFFVLASETSKEHFIFRSLNMSEKAFDTSKDQKEIRDEVKRFLQKYLGMDGVFLLHLIGQHADVVFTTELIAALWKKHYEFEMQRKAIKQMNRVLPLLTGEPQHVIEPEPHSGGRASQHTSPSHKAEFTKKMSLDQPDLLTERLSLQQGMPHASTADKVLSHYTASPTSQAKASVSASPAGHRRLSMARQSLVSAHLKRTFSTGEVEEDHPKFEESSGEDEEVISSRESKKTSPSKSSKKSPKESPHKESPRRRGQ